MKSRIIVVRVRLYYRLELEMIETTQNCDYNWIVNCLAQKMIAIYYLIGLLSLLLSHYELKIPYHQLSQQDKQERKRNNTFEEFDKDKDGFITMKDIESLLGPMHKNGYFKMFFKKYDLNRDGKVDLQEYHTMAIQEYNRWEEIEDREPSQEEIEEQKKKDKEREEYYRWKKQHDERDAEQQKELRRLYQQQIQNQKQDL